MQTKNIKKIMVFVMMISLMSSVRAEPQQLNKEEIIYQIDISTQITDLVGELFQDFTEGYIQPSEALQKISLWKNEYNKEADMGTEETERLQTLMNHWFSQLENYFIYYKNVNRENPEINLHVADASYKIRKEVTRLRYLVQ